MAQGRRAIETPKKKKWPLVLAILILAAVLAAGGAVSMGLLPAAQAQPTEEAGEVSAEEDQSAEASLPEETEAMTDPADDPLPGDGIAVCVDPGHGGNDPGTHDPNDESRMEKDDVLKFSLVLKSALEAQGIEVVMTRTDDSFPSLDERCSLANEAEVDYYLAIHRNSASMDACGIEIWRASGSSQETADLGEAIMAGLKSVGIQKDRGVNEGSQTHSGDYKVLRDTNMVSLLLEMGFMQNEEDNKLFDENQQEYAEAIAQAVLSIYQTYHADGDEAGIAASVS